MVSDPYRRFHLVNVVVCEACCHRRARNINRRLHQYGSISASFFFNVRWVSWPCVMFQTYTSMKHIHKSPRKQHWLKICGQERFTTELFLQLQRYNPGWPQTDDLPAPSSPEFASLLACTSSNILIFLQYNFIIKSNGVGEVLGQDQGCTFLFITHAQFLFCYPFLVGLQSMPL